MEPGYGKRRPALAAIMAGLGTAALFEVLALMASQVKTVRRASPWQEDPYDVALTLAAFAVPMLALAIALRLAAWRAPGGPDREQQTLRAAGTMTALVALTLAFEWAAVAVRAHRPTWNGWTAVLVGGLAVTSVATLAVAAQLARRRHPRGSAGRWRHDWLGDAVLVCERIPVLRRWATPALAGLVRRRAMTVFLALSALSATVLVGGLAIGERWTNPLLIAWALVVVTASHLAFCVVSNAVAGFVARPPRGRRRRVAEASTVTGCVAVQVATAFRDGLHRLIATGPVSTVPVLATLTLGAGLVAALATAGLLAARTPHTR
ncbi:MAG: hypothetical protein ACJ73S_27265 [Mycobacteriales bacterium]